MRLKRERGETCKTLEAEGHKYRTTESQAQVERTADRYRSTGAGTWMFGGNANGFERGFMHHGTAGIGGPASPGRGMAGCWTENRQTHTEVKSKLDKVLLRNTGSRAIGEAVVGPPPGRHHPVTRGQTGVRFPEGTPTYLGPCKCPPGRKYPCTPADCGRDAEPRPRRQ